MSHEGWAYTYSCGSLAYARLREALIVPAGGLTMHSEGGASDLCW